jgi:hypothetical protein
VSFCLGLAILVATAIVGSRSESPPNVNLLTIVIGPALLVTFVSGGVFISAVFFRDAIASKRSGYRFSLYTLLGWMTSIAIVLGVMKLLMNCKPTVNRPVTGVGRASFSSLW